MATGVDAAGNDLAITVLLDELAVAYIIFIIAFETFAFLVFLYGRSVTLAILEGALELGAIGIAGNALALDLAVQELPLEHIAALGGQLSLTIGSISFPQANVLVTILPDHRTLPLLVAFKELPGVLVAIGVTRDAHTRTSPST